MSIQSDITAKLRCETEMLFSHDLYSKVGIKKTKLLLEEHLKQRISTEDLHYKRAVGTAAIATPAPMPISSFPVEVKVDHIRDSQACPKSRVPVSAPGSHGELGADHLMLVNSYRHDSHFYSQ